MERARRNRRTGRAARVHRLAVEDGPGRPDPRRNVGAGRVERACRRSTRYDEARTAAVRRADMDSATAWPTAAVSAHRHHEERRRRVDRRHREMHRRAARLRRRASQPRSRKAKPTQ